MAVVFEGVYFLSELEFQEAVLKELPLLTDYANRLYRYQKADADDLVQRTFIHAVENRDKFYGGKLKAWLFTLMRNIFINEYRKQQRENNNIERFTLVHPQYSSHRVYDFVEYDHIVDLIYQLPYEYQETSYKSFVERKSYVTIAEETDTPLGTVMSRLFRARKILKSNLANMAAERGFTDKPLKTRKEK